MIRRRVADDFLLITQNDHAAFSGFLARHIGNEHFDALAPEVIAAIAAHDAGWPSQDDRPTLNAAGLPLHVFETPLVLAMEIWSASARLAEALGPYAALLVSLHQLALSDIARQRMDSRAHERGALGRDLFNLNKFQHAQIERQELLRRQLAMRTDLPLCLGLANRGVAADEDRLRFDFRMLTLCDRISLQVCCGELLFSCIEEIHARAQAAVWSIRTRYAGNDLLTMDPWPFDQDALAYQIPMRRVSGRQFETELEFRAAFDASKLESVDARITSEQRE
jgi:hypothetical protein